MRASSLGEVKRLWSLSARRAVWWKIRGATGVVVVPHGPAVARDQFARGVGGAVVVALAGEALGAVAGDLDDGLVVVEGAEELAGLVGLEGQEGQGVLEVVVGGHDGLDGRLGVALDGAARAVVGDHVLVLVRDAPPVLAGVVVGAVGAGGPVVRVEGEAPFRGGDEARGGEAHEQQDAQGVRRDGLGLLGPAALPLGRGQGPLLGLRVCRM